MTQQTVSVVVTAVDEIGLISQCLDSIRNQIFDGDIEIIVVVSGENDQIQEELKNYPEVHIQSHELTGEPGSPRNHGLQQASGKWICFIDADDVLGSNALQTRLNICLEHAEDEYFAGVAFRSERFVDVPTQEIQGAPVVDDIRKINIDHGFSCNSFNPVLGCMYRKRNLIDIGGFPTSGRAEDLWLLLRIGKSGMHMYASNLIDSGYRQVPNSRSSQDTYETLKSLLEYESQVVKLRAAGMTARSRIHRGVPFGIRKTYPDEMAFKTIMQEIGPEYIKELSTANLKSFIRGGLISVCEKQFLDVETERYYQLILELAKE